MAGVSLGGLCGAVFVGKLESLLLVSVHLPGYADDPAAAAEVCGEPDQPGICLPLLPGVCLLLPAAGPSVPALAGESQLQLRFSVGVGLRPDISLPAFGVFSPETDPRFLERAAAGPAVGGQSGGNPGDCRADGVEGVPDGDAG